MSRSQLFKKRIIKLVIDTVNQKKMSVKLSNILSFFQYKLKEEKSDLKNLEYNINDHKKFKTINYLDNCIIKSEFILKYFGEWKWFDLGDSHDFTSVVSNDILLCGKVQQTVPYDFTAITTSIYSEDPKDGDEVISWVLFCVNTKSPEFRDLNQIILEPNTEDSFVVFCAVEEKEKSNSWNWTEKYTEVYRKNGRWDFRGDSFLGIPPLAMVKVLRCNNVKIQVNDDPLAVRKKAQNRDQIKGYSKYTLILDNRNNYNSSNLGGTHASPRLHFRRGHVRSIGNDRYTWVRECMVGQSSGFIDKDYKIEM